MVAVWLCHHLDPAEVWRRPVRRALQQLGESQDARGHLGNPSIVQQFLGVAAPNANTRRFKADNRRPVCNMWVQHIQGTTQLAPSAVALARADPRQPAACMALRKLRRISSRPQQGDHRGDPLAGETVRERIEPDDHRLAGSLRRAHPRTRRPVSESRQRTTLVDPRGPSHQVTQAGRPGGEVDQG